MVDELSSWLIQHYGQEQFNPGLDRISEALNPLKSTLSKAKIVVVVGTNGKGETTHRLSRLLDGHRLCSWTSPHIERITERFCSEEGEITLEELTSLVKRCHEEAQRRKLRLTYYEFLFYVFCTWAEARNPEMLLLEVGLGGRLDAVNFFDADLILLPSISRDHQEYLGNRYDLILTEKLGVLRSKSTLFTAFDLNYLNERAENDATGLGARIFSLGRHPLMPKRNFSHRNQFLAYAAYIELIGGDRSYEKWKPRDEFLEHRGEVLQQGAEWRFFGSHNVDGLRKLILFLQSDTYNLPRMSFDAVLVAFSERRKEDLLIMLKMIKASGLKNITVTCFTHPKAASQEMMEGLAGHEGLTFVNDANSFVQGSKRGKILVTGSYYFLGHIKSLIRGHR